MCSRLHWDGAKFKFQEKGRDGAWVASSYTQLARGLTGSVTFMTAFPSQRLHLYKCIVNILCKGVMTATSACRHTLIRGEVHVGC